jgi:hypothetical protein
MGDHSTAANLQTFLTPGMRGYQHAYAQQQQQRQQQAMMTGSSAPPVYAPQHYPQPTVMQATTIPIPITSTHGMFTKNLIGSLCANATKLTDPEGKPGYWFILQDLSVRTEGNFRYVVLYHHQRPSLHF